MKAGAHDYVMKDRLARLVPAVQRELREVESRREQKRLQEARRNEQIMLARTEGIAHIGSWEWDIATDTMTWSEELFRIFQRDPREGAPRFAEHPAFYHPDDMARLQQAVEAAVTDGTPYEMELRAIRKDGETRICVARGVAELRVEGRVAHLFGSLQDITERLLMKEALKKSEERYRSLYADSRDSIMVLSMDQGFLAGNPATIELFACRDEKDFTTRSPESLSPEYQPDGVRSLDKFHEMMLLALENGSHFFEWTHRRADGTDFPATVLLSRIESSSTRLLQATVRDISAQKQTEEELQRTLESLRKSFAATIQVMVAAVESRDYYTAGHQIRSADLACAIATEMELPQEIIDGIHMAGSIHDIGKLSVPAEILSKPKKLTEIEFSLIKEHSRSGYEILRDVESPWPLAQIVYQHHERMDGSGYPRNLKGDEILLEARIMAVADVVESMASHRPYRPGLGIDAALNEIEKNRGTIYDKTVVDACLRLFREKGFKLEGT